MSTTHCLPLRRGPSLRRILGWALGALALTQAACDGGGGKASSLNTGATGHWAARSIDATVYVFNADLGGWRPNNGRWYSYQQSSAPCATGVGFETNRFSPASCFSWLTDAEGAKAQWVTSTGPWWIDPNHMMRLGGNGFGFINVLAFSQIPAALQSTANLDDSTVSFTARVDPAFSTVEADSAAGRRKAQI